MNKSMFKIFIINFFVLTVVFISCSKKDFNSSSSIDSFSVNQTGSDLPYIKITTQNLILNEPKVMANMEIFEKGEFREGNGTYTLIENYEEEYIKGIFYGRWTRFW